LSYLSIEAFCDTVCDDEVRPDIPENAPELVQDLLQRCWDSEPEERPTFKEINDVLEIVKIEHAIIDVDGREFWRSHFKSRSSVSKWLEFKQAFVEFVKTKRKEIDMAQLELDLKYFKALLAPRVGQQVKIDAFGALLVRNYFLLVLTTYCRTGSDLYFLMKKKKKKN